MSDERRDPPRCERRRSAAASAALVLILVGYSTSAAATDVSGVLFIAFYLYCAVVVLLGGLFFWACQVISNRRLKALARLSILIVLFAPVTHVVGPNEVVTQLGLVALYYPHNYWPHGGLLSHPISLAYGIALLATLPIVMLWMFVKDRLTRKGDSAPSGVSE